jgi:hypothetical protein
MGSGVQFFPQVIPASTVLGRLAQGTGPVEAIPFGALEAAFGRIVTVGPPAGGTTDDSPAFTAAFATGKLVYAPAGSYRLNNPSFTVPANSGLIGDGRATILNVFGASTPDRSAMNISPSLTGALFVGAGGNLFKDFVVQAADTFDYSKTFESWTAYNYSANNHLIVIAAGPDTIIERVHCKQVFLPIGAINQSRIKIDKCSVDRSVFAAIWTAGCSKISVSNGEWDRCGFFGGIVFSNVTDLAITGTSWLFNPESTGIDIGGGGTTSKRLAIAGNTVLAGDPITVEDGGSDIAITGNRVAVAPGYVSNLDLTGISLQLHDPANTPVSNAVISGNDICFYNPDLTYHDFLGSCIDVGGVAGGQNSSDVTVSGNMCRGGESGIDVHGQAGTVSINLAITGNHFTHNFYGIKLEKTSIGYIGNNCFNCGKTTTTGLGTFGIYMLSGDISDVVFSGNETIGYEFHIQQDVPGAATNLNCTRSVVQSHTFMANTGDLAAFTEYRNSGSGADLNLRALGRTQSLATANNLTAGVRGSKFALSGTTQINLLDNTAWKDGDVVSLMAQGGATTFKNSQVASGNFRPLNLATGADYVSGAGGLGILTLLFDKGSNVWREVSRVG